MEAFQSLNPPALQTSNGAGGNQKALQRSSHGKRGTVKAVLHMRLGAGAWVGVGGGWHLHPWSFSGLGLTRVPGTLLSLMLPCTGLQEMKQC